MQICRRDFVVATLSFVPAVVLIGLPVSAGPSEATRTAAVVVKPSRSRFAIDGWDRAAEGTDDQVLIRLSSTWRAATY